MNRRQFIGSAAAVSLTAAASFARAHDHAGFALGVVAGVFFAGGGTLFAGFDAHFRQRRGQA